MQTDTHRATINNRLSKEEEESVTFYQGHSQATANKFYEIKNKERAAQQTIRAHNTMYGEMPSLTIRKRNINDEYLPDDQFEGEEIRKRLQWTPDQERWILSWIEECKNNKEVLPSSKMNWIKCVKDMESDPKALEIFSPSHFDPAKLREFSKRLKKKRQSLSDMR